MARGIMQSVGVNGVNQKTDVRIIQIYLNSFSAWKNKVEQLKVDGHIGEKTCNAIRQFQSQAIGMKRPDGRVDPDGKTFQYLTMYHNQEQQNSLESGALKNSPTSKSSLITHKTINHFSGLGDFSVSYKNSVKKNRRVVSEYALSIIKIAIKESGMSTAVITSTLRTPEEQASIMLKNAKIDLKKQYRLYGKNGDAVLKVYDENRNNPDVEILKLMIDKINELEKTNRRVSNHCISMDNYQKKNIIDIGLNSTKNANISFNKEKFTKALESLNKEGYTRSVIESGFLTV